LLPPCLGLVQTWIMVFTKPACRVTHLAPWLVQCSPVRVLVVYVCGLCALSCQGARRRPLLVCRFRPVCMKPLLVILLAHPFWTMCLEHMWLILLFCPFGPVFCHTHFIYPDTYLSSLTSLVRILSLFDAHRLVNKALHFGISPVIKALPSSALGLC
jgi:hypothetical protein